MGKGIIAKNRSKKMNNQQKPTEKSIAIISITRFLATLNLIISIIGAIFVWITMGKTEIQFYSEIVDHIVTRYETNWVAISIGFALIFEGLIVFLALFLFAGIAESIFAIHIKIDSYKIK